jgi:hypothetical protein
MAARVVNLDWLTGVFSTRTSDRGEYFVIVRAMLSMFTPVFWLYKCWKGEIVSYDQNSDNDLYINI